MIQQYKSILWVVCFKGYINNERKELKSDLNYNDLTQRKLVIKIGSGQIYMHPE